MFATDANYLVPTYVAINSLLRHLDEQTNIEIFILHAKLTEREQKPFYELSDKIRFIKVDVKNLQLSEKLSYISIATYYRFFIPELLCEYDKCLYLDSDIIIKQDITPLLHEPIENYTLMGVRNFFLMELQPEFVEERCQECSINSLSHYVNAGVLLMNLKKLRENDLYLKMIEEAKHKKYSYNDQDILNKFCENEIGLISVRYNFMVQYLKYKSIVSEVLEECIDSISQNPTIIHYPTKRKPWMHIGYLMADKWAEELQYIKSEHFKKQVLKPFIKNNRNNFSRKERLVDYVKYLYRKYILRNFTQTTQRLHYKVKG